MLLAGPGRQTEESATALSEQLRDAGGALGDLPLVGDERRHAVRRGRRGLRRHSPRPAGPQVEAVEDLAFWLGLAVGAIPILVVAAFYVPSRVRFVRRATAGQRFVDAGEDLDLFALRALANQPLHVLARISRRPRRRLAAPRPGIVARALAELELRSDGLRLAGAPARARHSGAMPHVRQARSRADRRRPRRRVRAADEGRPRARSAAKFRKMAARPARVLPRQRLPLLRRRHRRARTRSPTSDSGRIWIHGDLHVENFGTYLNSDGRLVFDVNDFDEAYLGRFTWDLQRFAASLALVGWQKALPEDDVRRLIGRYVRAYLAQVDDYRDRATTTTTSRCTSTTPTGRSTPRSSRPGCSAGPTCWTR